MDKLKCPHCTSEDIELIAIHCRRPLFRESDDISHTIKTYLCNCCSKEFKVEVGK